MKTDIFIIGAGISGLTLAERYANIMKKNVVVIDKRNHLGGNCYDFYDKNNILVPKYGPHFFHTNDEIVWKYVSLFTKWTKYEHRVLSNLNGLLLPIPVNITTVNKLFKLQIKTKEEFLLWLKNNTQNIKSPKNSEEAALKRVGKVLYESLFKEYTKKQWDKWPSELSPEIMNRIPIRTNFDDRYFTDKYQCLPKDGYTKLFEKMTKNKRINILLKTDWKDCKNSVTAKKIFFTGPIDQFFNYNLKDQLEYRSLKFKYRTVNKEYYQKTTQINYSSIKIPYTRITEPKHATRQKNKKTTIIKEYPTWEGEPYYPVLNKKNIVLYNKYQQQAKKLERQNIYLVGRLANYKYFNMDQAFKNALNLFVKINKKYEN